MYGVCGNQFPEFELSEKLSTDFGLRSSLQLDRVHKVHWVKIAPPTVARLCRNFSLNLCDASPQISGYACLWDLLNNPFAYFWYLFVVKPPKMLNRSLRLRSVFLDDFPFKNLLKTKSQVLIIKSLA